MSGPIIGFVVFEELAVTVSDTGEPLGAELKNSRCFSNPPCGSCWDCMSRQMPEGWDVEFLKPPSEVIR